MKQVANKSFWGIPIKFILTDEPQKEGAMAMIRHLDNGFEAVFVGVQSFQSIAHESYHLFMDLLDYVKAQPATFKELTSEVYAYSFTEVYNLVQETVTQMKLYNKLCDKMELVK